MMKRLITPILILVTVCAALGVAECAMATSYPLLAGTYKTLLGTIQPGRATESNPYDGGEGINGNMLHAESWDGAVLGANWELTCAQKSGPAVLVYDGVVGGNGQRTYVTPYSGGSLWLSGTGAWSLGAPYYTATLTSLTVTATKQYLSDQLVGVVSNINFMGNFEGAGQCFTMDISNAAFVGMTGYPLMPPPLGVWPDFLGPLDCSLVGAHGTYWNVSDLTLSILGDCATPTRTSTWGRVKSLYR